MKKIKLISAQPELWLYELIAREKSVQEESETMRPRRKPFLFSESTWACWENELTRHITSYLQNASFEKPLELILSDFFFQGLHASTPHFSHNSKFLHFS
jgi:hypothetical protein